MKKFILAALLALPLTVFAHNRATAGDCCTPLYRIGFSLGLVFRGWCGCDYSCCKHSLNKGTGHCGPCGKHGHHGGGCSFPGTGPWYGYWPYPAHFRHPAPTGYPFYPAPLTWTGFAQAPPTAPTYPVAQLPGGYDVGNAMAVMPMNGNFAGQTMPVGYQMMPSYWHQGR